MKKLLAFAGSNSSTSINHKLVQSVVTDISDCEVTLIKLTDYLLPIFSEDIEKESGHPEILSDLLDLIKSHDGCIMSVNEHNGSVSAFFKNTLDWLSRIEYKFLAGKKVVVLSTSPGKRGALSALEYTTSVLPRYDAELIGQLAVPSFGENFDSSTGRISNDAISQELQEILHSLIQSL